MCTCVCVCMCVCSHMYVSVHACMCAQVHFYECVCVCGCACVCAAHSAPVYERFDGWGWMAQVSCSLPRATSKADLTHLWWWYVKPPYTKVFSSLKTAYFPHSVDQCSHIFFSSVNGTDWHFSVLTRMCHIIYSLKNLSKTPQTPSVLAIMSTICRNQCDSAQGLCHNDVCSKGFHSADSLQRNSPKRRSLQWYEMFIPSQN